MKYRESGMPEETMWDTFFNPEEVLRKMGVDESVHVLLDIGCGYGTFLIPASKIVQNKAIGIDIEKEMIDTCQRKLRENRLTKAELILGDISIEKSNETLSTYEEKIDYISLFNIIHCEEPVKLLKVVYQLLNKGGKLGVIHWKYEDTPRGPSMDIRPTPDKINKWAADAGFDFVKQVDLKPYHYGLVFIK